MENLNKEPADCEVAIDYASLKDCAATQTGKISNMIDTIFFMLEYGGRFEFGNLPHSEQ